MLDFESTPGTVRCSHCGCKQMDHRGGSPESPKHTCPPTVKHGWPAPFPRTFEGEDKSRNYRPYWARIETYWSAETEFYAQ